MNTKVKKSIFWVALITPMVLGVYFLFGGYSALASGSHGHGRGGMGHGGGFGGYQVMNGAHHGGFSWIAFLLILIVGIALVVLFVKWLRKKSKASAMKQFIYTSIITTPKPIMNQTTSILDQWEKNLTNKKNNY
ncbi:hypothetical protein [Neobacillus sp. DY30]|uniref:hypothetical protein n=1 Tax=Neobacillus sp. DY30 TaxID=3047871 RepID=UPI0024C06AD7|nr:hypothetical protein [Neobacillus sp. DY30]WHY02762.1 hypothetical protein QNH29_11305 [Neobacillus sp. DY30]